MIKSAEVFRPRPISNGMKAVILAAGEGKRMQPLTFEVPKPLTRTRGKTLLEHTFDVLPQEISEVVLVVGYLGQKIVDFCGDNFYGKKITYVWQDKKLGTGHALRLCEPHLRGTGKFLFMFSDDLFDKESIADMITEDAAIHVAEHKEPWRFGVVSLNNDGSVHSIIEKPDTPSTNLVLTGVKVLSDKIFDYEPDLHPVSKEYYDVTMIQKMIQDGHTIVPVRARFWFPIATPEDLKSAESYREGEKKSQ